METTPSLLSCAIFACLPGILLGIGELPDLEYLSEELYCVGCEYTVKELYDLMQKSPLSDDTLETRVSESLQELCNEDHFNGAQIPKQYLLRACEFLQEENGELLKPLVVSHFRQSSQATFYDLSHQVCMDMSNACMNVPGEKRFPDHLDSDLKYDSKSQTFRVKEGRKPRVPNPVRDVKEDL